MTRSRPLNNLKRNPLEVQHPKSEDSRPLLDLAYSWDMLDDVASLILPSLGFQRNSLTPTIIKDQKM